MDIKMTTTEKLNEASKKFGSATTYREAMDIAQDSLRMLDEFIPEDARNLVRKMFDDTNKLLVKEYEGEIEYLEGIGDRKSKRRIADIREIIGRIE